MGFTLQRHATPSITDGFAQMTRAAIVHSAPDHQPYAIQATAVVIPTISIAVPAGPSNGTFIEGSDCLPTSFTPEEDVQLVNLLCDPETLKTARRHIKRLGFNVRSVRSSFENVICSIEALERLNLDTMERFHLREALRQLPVLKGLLQRFNKAVRSSRKEALNAAAVIISYESAVLDAVHDRQGVNALKEEVESIAEAISTHEANAEKLGGELTRISDGVRSVATTIKCCVRKNRGRIEQTSLDDLRQKTDELDAKVELCSKSRWVFLEALFGIGQYCAGLAVAAFGGDTGLFSENDIKRHVSLSKIWDYMRMARLQRWRSIPDLYEVVQQTLTHQIVEKASLGDHVARLHTGVNKIANMGGLWNSIHMDLHKISEWLSIKFVGGELQGSLELYRMSADNMRQHTRDLIDQLLKYSDNQL